MTNQMEQAHQLRTLISRAQTLEFGPVNNIEFFPEENVLGIKKGFILALYAQSAGAYASIGESLLALICSTENLSAINARKKLVEKGELDPEEDLHLLNVLLSSHLPKHNKSPMLWQHRRWLLQKHPQHLALNVELEVLGNAGDRHPLNYYAWSYARWLASIIVEEADRQRMREWAWTLCYSHISDTSMWSFLAHIDVNGIFEGRAQEMYSRYHRDAIRVYLRSRERAPKT